MILTIFITDWLGCCCMAFGQLPIQPVLKLLKQFSFIVIWQLYQFSKCILPTPGLSVLLSPQNPIVAFQCATIRTCHGHTYWIGPQHQCGDRISIGHTTHSLAVVIVKWALVRHIYTDPIGYNRNQWQQPSMKHMVLNIGISASVQMILFTKA